jgi:hypothetical protein
LKYKVFVKGGLFHDPLQEGLTNRSKEEIPTELKILTAASGESGEKACSADKGEDYSLISNLLKYYFLHLAW